MDAEGIFLAWAFTFFFYQMKKADSFPLEKHPKQSYKD